MAFTKADIRTDARNMLRDQASADFTDAELDAAADRAVSEFEKRFPRQLKADLTADGTGAFDASSLTEPLEVVAVEYPKDQLPRRFLRFDVWGTTVTTTDEKIGNNEGFRVYYAARHTLHASVAGSTTLLAQHRPVIAQGTVAEALRSSSTRVDQIHIGGPRATAALAASARTAEAEFVRLMDRLPGGRPIRSRRLYSPAQSGPIGPRETTDPGP